MADSLDVRVQLKLKDNLSKAAGTALDALAASAQKAGLSVDAVGRGGVKRVVKDADASAKGMETLGRKARQTRQEVSAVGDAGQDAARAMQDAETRGRRMGQTLTRARDATRDMARNVAGLGKGMAAVGGGVMAGGYVASRAIARPVAYESQMLAMANTAFSDRDAEGRKAGAKELDTLVQNAVRQGGGTREDAAGALQGILASGLSKDVAATILPVIMKAATATQANPDELAAILTKGISQKAFTPEDAAHVLDMAVTAGQAGQFELKDMARWLPQIIASGKGMKSLDGVMSHLANVQGVANVTGSADQAGNDYVNLLDKITSTDATRNFKDLGINLPKELVQAKAKGVDPVSAFVALAERVVGKDKNYQQIQAKIAATSDKDEKRALLEQAAEILQGSALGKIVQDRQAALALAGVMTQKDFIGDVRGQLQNADGATETSYQVMASGTEARLQQAANAKDSAATDFFEKIKGPLDELIGGATSLAQTFPELATAAYAVVTAFGVLGAVGAASSGVGTLLGRGRGGRAGQVGRFGRFGRAGKTSAPNASLELPAVAETMPGTAAESATVKAQRRRMRGRRSAPSTGPAAAGVAAPEQAVARPVAQNVAATVGEEVAGALPQAGKGALQAARATTRGAIPLQLAFSALDVAATEMDPTLTRPEKNTEHAATAGAAVGGVGGMWGGAAAGAAVGSIVPIFGTAVGAVIGGILGSMLGSWAGEKGGRAVGEKVFEAQPQPIELHTTLQLDGNDIAETMDRLSYLKDRRR